MAKNLFKKISHQIVCSKCEEEFLAGITDSRTLQDYTKLDVGFTECGLLGNRTAVKAGRLLRRSDGRGLPPEARLY